MIAIIPARGGSKGLPGKNIRPFNGIPLIAHSILTAQKSRTISGIYVSTDDEKIASIAMEYGALVPYLRPAELADDNSMVMDAYIHMCDYLSNKEGVDTKNFAALLPTSPFRTSEDIDSAIEIFYSKRASSVISITEAPVPFQWYRKVTGAGKLVAYSNEFDAISNRQQIEHGYIPNGSIYIFKTECLRSTRQYYTEDTYPFVMPAERSLDIDNELQFKVGEFIMNERLLND